MSRFYYLCARGCGEHVLPHYRYCPECGRPFAPVPGPAITVRQSRQRYRGQYVEARRAPSPSTPNTKE